MRGFVLRWLGFEERVNKAVEQESGKDAAIKKRQAVVGFHKPIIMDDAAKSRDINEAMKHLPALAAEAANPVFRGSEREGNQQNETEKANGNEGAFVDVFPHAAKVKGLVGAEIGKEVEADVEKGEQAEHAAETNEVGELEEFAEGSNGEGDEKKAKGPVTGKVLYEFDGIGGELAVVSASSEKV